MVSDIPVFGPPTVTTIDAVATPGAVLNVEPFPEASVFFNPTGNHTVVFEVSPDSTNGTDGVWYGVVAQGLFQTGAATTANPTTTPVAYRVAVGSAKWLRVRVTTQTTAGAVVVTMVGTETGMITQVGISNVASTIPAPSPTAGAFSAQSFTASTTAKVAVKATAGTVGHLAAYNPNSTPVWLHVFNVASAGVTVGTTAPNLSYMIPAQDAAGNPGRLEIPFPEGLRLTTAITMAPWTTNTNSGGVAPTTGITLNVAYV